MGTTVTTNLGLIKPDTSESIREDLPTFAGWAAQNGINCDKVDALFRATSHSYVPIWSASVSPPTLGAAGLLEGKYLRLWPRLVIGQIRLFTGGVGFVPGSGSYSFTLPTGIATEFASFFDAVALGKAILMDNDNVLNSTVCEVQYNSTTGLLLIRPTNGLSWTQVAPFTLAQNDRFSCQFIYPTSDA